VFEKNENSKKPEVKRKFKKKRDKKGDEFNRFLKELDVMLMIDEARILKNEVGDMGGTLKLCEKILKLSPDNRDALLLKAGALGELGRFKEEAEILAEIIRLYPENHEVYYLLALRFFSMGEDDKALRYIDMSLERGETFDNLIAKAQFLHLMEDEEYKKYLKKAERLDKKRFDNFMKNCWTLKAEYDVDIIAEYR